MTLFRSVLMFVMCLSLGCSQKNELHGKWQWVEGAGDESMLLSFSVANSVVFQDSDGALHGKYEINSPRALTIAWEDGAIEVLEINGDTIFLGGSYSSVFRKK